MSLNASLKFVFTESNLSKVFVIASETCSGGVEAGNVRELPLIGFAGLHLFGPRLAPVFSKRTPLQMCGGSRVAAMYSKSASEGSSECGVELCGVVSLQPLV